MLEILYNSRPGNGHIQFADEVQGRRDSARDSKKQDPQASSLGPLQIPCAFLCPLFQDTLMGLTRKKMTLAPDPQAVDCSLVACSRKALGM